MYKFEIHLHTNNCSECAISDPEEIIIAAKKRGYNGIVVTNHFYHGNTAINRNLPWKEFVEAYEKDYKELKELGKKVGITVFFGLEEGFAPGREMLIYGIEPQVFAEHPEFIMMSAKEKSDFIHEKGGLCVCAHPFRDRSYIPDPHTPPDPDLFDGIEGFNLFNQIDENEKAFVFALNNKKLITSGGDIHRAKDFGGAGIAFSTPVTDYKTFMEKLRSGDYKLLYPDHKICGE